MSGNKAMRRAAETKDGIRLVEKLPLLHGELELITPEIADKYARLDGRNRPIRWKRAEKMSKKMVDGKWEITSHGISFDDSGQLIDGQHVLQAIKLAQIPVYIYVMRGNPKTSRETFNDGMANTIRDLACMRVGRKDDPFAEIEAAIARGVCTLMGESTSKENVATVLTANSELTQFLRDQVKGMPKSKARTYILSAICYLAKDRDEVRALLRNITRLTETLMDKMRPIDLDESPPRGLNYRNALSIASELVGNDRAKMFK